MSACTRRGDGIAMLACVWARRKTRLGRDGVAALEMALVSPVLIALSAGISDCSLVYHKKLQLSSTLAAAAEYAFNKGQSETGTALETDVAAFVSTASPIALTGVSVTYYGGATSTSYYCVSTAGIVTGSYTQGAACTDGSGSVAGQYISISGTFPYAAVFPVDQSFMPKTYAQTVFVRLD
jgi:Flp pilus assembly protein TadG